MLLYGGFFWWVLFWFGFFSPGRQATGAGWAAGLLLATGAWRGRAATLPLHKAGPRLLAGRIVSLYVN